LHFLRLVASQIEQAYNLAQQVDEQIDYQPMTFQSSLIYTGMRWSEFADKVEVALEQLESANLLEFQRGKYSPK
jgi:hypothetical protein